MKTKHIINIGYPKCGTTWCWDSLSSQLWFSQPKDKENYDLIYGRKTIQEYVQDYEKFDITGNFCPSMFAIDHYMIQQLSEFPTISVSLILRNPFDLYWSLYNFLENSHYQPFDQYIKNLIEQGWFNRFATIYKRWSNVFPTERFKIFLYDDLKSNQTLFIDNYYSEMNLPKPVNYIQEPSNVTKYQNTTHLYQDVELVSTINQEIKNLQELIDKNITHWLK